MEMPPNWAATPTGNREAARRPHTPAVDAQAPRSRERGPWLRPGPSLCAGLQPSATGQRAEGRLRTDGGAASSPARTSVAVSPPRAEREQQQVFRGRLGRLQRGSRPQQAGTGRQRRAAHSPSTTGRPRQVFAPPGPGTPPPLPGDSARSCRCCRPRAPGARAPRRSLRAITYRAVRGRRARGRGARPEPSNRLTRECRSQSHGRL